MPNETMYRILLDDYACSAFCSFYKYYFGTKEQIDKFMKSYSQYRTEKNAANISRYEKQLLKLFEVTQEYKYGALCDNSDIKLDIFDDSGKIEHQKVQKLYRSYGEHLALELYKQAHDENTYDIAWQRYLDGDEDASVGVAMNTFIMVDKTKQYAKKSIQINNGKTAAYNIYGYPHNIKFDTLYADVAWVSTNRACVVEEEQSDEKEFLRIVKYNFKGISRENTFTHQWEDISLSWGIPCMVNFSTNNYDQFKTIRNEIEYFYYPKCDLEIALLIEDKKFESEQELLADIDCYKFKDNIDIDYSKFYVEITGDG